MEQAPIVKEPSVANERGTSLWIEDRGLPVQARIGDRISLNGLVWLQTVDCENDTDIELPFEEKDKMVCQVRAVLTSLRSDEHGDMILSGSIDVMDINDRQVMEYVNGLVEKNPATDNYPIHATERCIWLGDICSVLHRRVASDDGTFVCVLVSSFWRTRRVGRTNVVLLFRVCHLTGRTLLVKRGSTSAVPALLLRSKVSQQASQC